MFHSIYLFQVTLGDFDLQAVSALNNRYGTCSEFFSLLSRTHFPLKLFFAALALLLIYLVLSYIFLLVKRLFPFDFLIFLMYFLFSLESNHCDLQQILRRSPHFGKKPILFGLFENHRFVQPDQLVFGSVDQKTRGVNRHGTQRSLVGR